ncbi:MAG: hypothetical protein GEV07_05585 [Streptosporangiales bacterium]|nr:hypothetical protein [Streptosporangiales bacterium]
MTVTVDTLRGVNPGALESLGFITAADRAGSAADAFDRVRSAVRAGRVWSGEGQPEASTVVQIDALALAVARAQMTAADTTARTLGLALHRARGGLLEAVREVDADPDLRLTDEGTVEFVGEPIRHGSGFSDGAGGDKAAALTRVIRLILIFAETADATARTAFDRIAHNTPVFSDVADAGFLARNTQALDAALREGALARARLRAWEQAPPVTYAQYLQLASELDARALEALAGLPLAIESAVHDSGPFFAAAGFFAPWNPPVAVVAAVAGGGVATFHVGPSLYGIFKPYLEGVQLPDRGGAPGNVAGRTPEVDDAELRGIVTTHFDVAAGDVTVGRGSGTLADLARYQRATGQQLSPSAGLNDLVEDLTGQPLAERDAVRQATELRGELRSWLTDNPDASAADRQVARYVLADLDDALATDP